ncbi:MAG: hypothetical protein KBD55_00950 [Candidatus Pacebacteria bacterium]|nr:hypothetical protein [Candidatus Paceibacterota bacterium]
MNLKSPLEGRPNSASLKPKSKETISLSPQELKEKADSARIRVREATTIEEALIFNLSELKEALAIPEEVPTMGDDDVPELTEDEIPKTDEGKTHIGTESDRKPEEIVALAKETFDRRSPEEIEQEIESLKKKKKGFAALFGFTPDERILELEENLNMARSHQRREEALISRREQARTETENREIQQKNDLNAKKELFAEDRRKYPSKYYILDNMHPVNFYVLFEKMRDDVSKEEIDTILGVDGTKLEIIDVPEISPARMNVVAFSSNGLYLRLNNIKELLKSGQDTINPQDPRARYDLYAPNGDTISFGRKVPDFGMAHRELRNAAEEYQRKFI